MKKIKKFFVILFLFIIVTVSAVPGLQAEAATKAAYPPYAKIEYSYKDQVAAGTIRYISQNPNSAYFIQDYWGKWSAQAKTECLTSSISMALSFIGVNKTPLEILDKWNGSTVRTGWGPTYVETSFENAWKLYETKPGEYSPVIIHLCSGYSSGSHFVLVVGKKSSDVYEVIDPYSDVPWYITIKGNKASYVRNKTTYTDILSYGAVYQNVTENMSALNTSESVNGESVISGYSFPEILPVGQSFSLKGTVTSPTKITSLTVGIYTKAKDGECLIGKKVSPNATSYSLSSVDKYITFGTLKRGAYYYIVRAKNAKGVDELLNVKFYVLEDDISAGGVSKPGTLTLGSPFSIKGTLRSTTPITAVTVEVADKKEGGKRIIGQTVHPKTNTYDLGNLDAAIKFGSLPAGTHYYIVRAKNAAGVQQLVTVKFTVK